VAIDRLDYPQWPFFGNQRRGQNRPGNESGVMVDSGIEARVGAHVVDFLGTAAAEHGARDPVAGGKSELGEPRPDFRVFLRDVREVQFSVWLVEEQDRDALCAQNLPAFGDHERDQLVELRAARERVPQLVNLPVRWLSERVFIFDRLD
jgi:hypothetical protein